MWKPKLALTGIAAVLSLALSPLDAAQVTLNSLDGTVSMSGDLLEFDGITYRLQMLIGEISIDASQVVCVGGGCPNMVAELTEFTIVGSNSIGIDLLPSLIEVFALERGGDLEVSLVAEDVSVYNVLEPDGSSYAEITVISSDSDEAFSSLLDGSAIVGMSTRPVSAAEASASEQAGKGALNSADQERILALDGVVAAVNRANPVSILSFAQIAAIYEGSVTNWNQVGGLDAPISLYRRADETGTTAIFSAVAMAEGQHAFSTAAQILATDANVSDAVSADINGIGLTSYAQERNARALEIRSVCGQLFGPSEFSIKSEEYPLSHRMFLYTNSGAIPDVATAFLDFATSETAQSVVTNAGFVDQDASLASLDHQGRRMAQAIVSSTGRSELLQLQDLTAILLDAERLSFTLHRDQSGAFDARAQADIARLAAMIRNGEFASRQILVFGFSDNTAPVNAQLSATQDMAEQARNAIVSATGRANLGNVRISPIGYGRLLPLGCNETARGQASNNRVEIWVK